MAVQLLGDCCGEVSPYTEAAALRVQLLQAEPPCVGLVWAPGRLGLGKAVAGLWVFQSSLDPWFSQSGAFCVMYEVLVDPVV